MEGLFETKAGRGGVVHKAWCLSIGVALVSILFYRLTHIPTTKEEGRYVWMGMFFSEIVFGVYWIITQSGRWRLLYRYPFRDRLSSRFGNDKLPGMDVFVCTADPILEPPCLVINTVLSVMSYNYPPQKLSIYLSDDGGSELTFYALFEASIFCRHWIPFTNKYNVEPRSPQVYFSQNVDIHIDIQEWTNVKQMYQDMKSRIDSVVAMGYVPKEIREQHKGFSEWNSNVTKQDHQSIVQILIDGWNPKSSDAEGNRMPSLIYLAREKRPGCPHNFKAGSMNSLIRVSSEISNAPFILNVDCDMYSNDPDAVKDALCFFLDETRGPQIPYVQHPQLYNNTMKNDVYANVNYAVNQIELAGLDGFGVALYIGTGCFHRRKSLSGDKYTKDCLTESQNLKDNNVKGRSLKELEEAAKVLADCSYEKGTLWGKEMGLVYGCAVEDIVTGLTIQCRGWKPVYYLPKKPAFQGAAPVNLDISLIQFKRWSEGMFQLFLSKYCPFIYGRGKIQFGGQMGYCIYLVWPMLSLPTLCYCVFPSLSLLNHVPLFPQVSSLWFVPFAYFFVAKTVYTLVEELLLGNSLRGWWNLQRMTLIRRTTAYLFALIDVFVKLLGRSETAFALTAKVVDEEAQKRYARGLIEFGSVSAMMFIIATLALLNLFGFVLGIVKVFFSAPETFKIMAPPLSICGAIVLLNLPIYDALFFRSDKGSIPFSVTFKSVGIASIVLLLLSKVHM